jgi:thioredoxin-dependent peroxiredoxin
MAELKPGRAAPEIDLPTDTGKVFKLSTERGHPVVLTFYSDGKTEGCAIQNTEYSALLPQFEALGAKVVAIAPQDAKACASFRAKHRLAHILLADDGLKSLKAYGLWQQKKLWGHEYMGVIRTSVIVDATGKIAEIIPATRIKGHAAKVLDAAKKLGA